MSNILINLTINIYVIYINQKHRRRRNFFKKLL